MSKYLPGERGIYQLLIIHLSDIHFGSRHAFNRPRGPDGTRISSAGLPSFTELLLKDLEEDDPVCPVCIAITGDFTSMCEEKGFDEAGQFLKQLAGAEVFGMVRGTTNIHIVPGNHDINFRTDDDGLKWYLWTKFVNAAFGGSYSTGKPLEFVELHDHSREGYVVLTLNSERHVREGCSDTFRGQVDQEQLAKVASLLEANKTKLEKSLCVALIHHHPVLIPHLVEEGRGYDAVVNSGLLLNLLNKHGFHLVLHGHKHWPCAFTSDARSAYESAYVRPIMIVSGGSVGSKELPTNTDINCYNRIRLKWNSGSEEMRVRVETRGLQRRDEHNQAIPAAQWFWKTIRSDDRSFYRGDRVPGVSSVHRSSPRPQGDAAETVRKLEYKRCRNNMAVVEVRPSFDPREKYEAVFWIVGHSGKDGKDYRKPREIPVQVTWSAGPLFMQKTVRREEDSRFAGSYSYYGPMIVQGELEFEDGAKKLVHVYARIPSEGDFIVRKKRKALQRK
jgi:3',5'-cyclic AMP phosphodiesterase CpdA